MSNDATPRRTAWRAVKFVAVAGALVSGLVLSAGSPATTVVLGAIGSLVTFLVSKNYEFRKQREAELAEKKREVYRDLLEPWAKGLSELKSNKATKLSPQTLAAAFGGAFDTVLYGSESVVRRYADLRAPETSGDPLGYPRALSALLLAMREDVTGEKLDVPEDVLLRMFTNLTPEQMVAIRGTRGKS